MIAMITSFGLMAGTHDSVANKQNGNTEKVYLKLDSLKVIEADAEQPVFDEIFVSGQSREKDTKIRLEIYGQHLSEPRDEQTLGVL